MPATINLIARMGRQQTLALDATRWQTSDKDIARITAMPRELGAACLRERHGVGIWESRMRPQSTADPTAPETRNRHPLIAVLGSRVSDGSKP